MTTKHSHNGTSTRIVILCVLLSSLMFPRPAMAVDGLPGSPLFGYGARLDLQGQGIRQAIELAAGMNLSWLMVEFNWSFYWSDPMGQPNWNQLDNVAALAYENGITLGISISDPAKWAITLQGPDPDKTTLLILELVQRYSGIVLAVELFPGVNTLAGWSAYPNPKDYTILLHTVSSALKASHLDVQLITSLSPVSPAGTSADIADNDFLNELYLVGWQAENTILGIYFNELTGDAIQSPATGELPVLRHYEELRNILISNNDAQRLIWVTRFSWPVEYSGGESQEIKQAGWLFQAYRLLTAQLYIGAAFFEQINPNSALPEVSSLLQSDATIHPACSLIAQLTNATNIIIPDPDQKILFFSSIDKKIVK